MPDISMDENAMVADMVNKVTHTIKKTSLQVDSMNRDMRARREHLLAALTDLREQRAMLDAQIDDHEEALDMVDAALTVPELRENAPKLRLPTTTKEQRISQKKLDKLAKQLPKEGTDA